MEVPSHTSAGDQRNYFPGRMIHLGEGAAWQDIIVEIHHRDPVAQTLLIPALAEPQLIWQISGHLLCSDRDLGGQWSTHKVEPGDLFLTTSSEPYELKWKATAEEPNEDKHVTIGLSILARVAKEFDRPKGGIPRLKEFNGIRDSTIISFLEMLRRELSEQKTASPSFVQGIAQSLATHLIRCYRDEESRVSHRPSALPAFQLQRVLKLMDASLGEGINVGTLAAAVQISEAHFSRLFKGSTGFSPSRYFIRLRLSKSQELLRETRWPVIQIGMEVGYASPSHFAHVFRKGTGMTPQEYRQRMTGEVPADDFSRIAIG